MIRGYLMKDYKSMIASDSYLKPFADFVAELEEMQLDEYIKLVC